MNKISFQILVNWNRTFTDYLKSQEAGKSKELCEEETKASGICTDQQYINISIYQFIYQCINKSYSVGEKNWFDTICRIVMFNLNRCRIEIIGSGAHNIGSQIGWILKKYQGTKFFTSYTCTTGFFFLI